MKDSDVKRIIENLEKTLMVYSEEWDAFYNPDTNEWTESKCDDPTCHYCTGRPERPLENGKPS
jgi:hypothetical protein